ncbi:hypothetical protein BSZ22_15530 [Bradyrhizobium canariense]|uniref:Uncharacterized protein n=1 Tax=Bradyrhizobium canariense TaxID=255045 RepID=A0A1X3FU31_9BRAD|nr:hypothetical protein BSZ22_15530 [Bradyrhizobium canariense]OSI74052.1 hypothetical protein BSZ23_32430 [Bradyrhizobium canariense]OSI84412.1 hypothetical protein BSZ25_34630 [Bradyrhizobium canariense]OSI89447.1 hypothetical protein BSZ24_22660 [Bradyrhizobium canariense]OSJ02012.1 hypothetical protein BSZ16_18565 [Bradyrhizobium canariense]
MLLMWTLRVACLRPLRWSSRDEELSSKINGAQITFEGAFHLTATDSLAAKCEKWANCEAALPANVERFCYRWTRVLRNLGMITSCPCFARRVKRFR